MEHYTGYNQNMESNGNTNMEEMFLKLKKEILINRIISCVTLVMTTVILVLAILAFVEIKEFFTEIEPVVEELSKIDMEALNASLNHFNDIIETFNLDDVMETINSIDFEGINEILEGLDVNQ